MGIAEDLWGSISNPAPTYRSLSKRATVTQGAFLVIIAAVISGLIAGAIGIWGVSTDTGTIFFNAFIDSFVTIVLTFVAIIALVHIFLHALEKTADVMSYAATLAFPYAGMTILASIVSLLMTGIQRSGATGDVLSYIIAFFVFLTVSITIYAYILYTIVTKESYKTSLPMAAVMIILAAMAAGLLTTMLSLIGALSGML